MAKKKQKKKTGVSKFVDLFPKSSLEKMTVEQLETKTVYMESLIETIQEKWNDDVDKATKEALDIQSANEVINDMLSCGVKVVTDDEMDSYVKQRDELEQRLTGSQFYLKQIAYKNNNKIEYLHKQIKSVRAVLDLKKDNDIKDAEAKAKKKVSSK